MTLHVTLEISGRQLATKKKFRQSKFLETVATVATSHFSFYYYHFPKESGRKKQSLLSEKNVITFNVLL